MVLPIIIPINATPPVTIAAAPSRSGFNIGDTVIISGFVTPVMTEQPVVIYVFNPNGISFRSDEITIDSSGRFRYTFELEGWLATKGIYKVDIRYLFYEKSLTINVKECFSVPTERISVFDPGLVDATDSKISKVFVDQPVLLQARIANNACTQDYAYIIQIKDSNDIVVSLSWVQGSVNAGQSFSVAQSWLPDAPGTYTVQMFVWESITNPVAPASTVRELEISVSD